MLSYTEILNDNEIKKFVKIARDVWHEYFPSLISIEQIEYMLNKFQSFSAVKKQMVEGYKYYFVYEDKMLVGYVVFAFKDDFLFLSKLYFIKKFRDKGFGRKTLKFLKIIAEKHQKTKIKLTVNKYNESSIQAYKNWGFEIEESKKSDIGSGYFMDDYIMINNFTLSE